jgi:hypothetical protein
MAQRNTGRNTPWQGFYDPNLAMSINYMTNTLMIRFPSIWGRGTYSTDGGPLRFTTVRSIGGNNTATYSPTIDGEIADKHINTPSRITSIIDRLPHSFLGAASLSLTSFNSALFVPFHCGLTKDA